MDNHTRTVRACDRVLSHPEDEPKHLVFASVVGDDPADIADQQLALVFLLWLRDELGLDAVAQVRARHVSLVAG